MPALRERERERERERDRERDIDFNYFNEAKYSDFKDIKLPYFHCELVHYMEENLS